MPRRDLLWYIDRSLQDLARDVPEAYQGIVAATGGLVLGVVSETARGVVAVLPPRIEVAGPGPRCDVTTEVKETVILDLIDGRVTLGEALSTDRLVLRGKPPDLERLISGLHIYLRAAVRSGAMQALLDAFRADARG